MGQERSEKQSESGSLSQGDQPRRDLSYGFPLRPERASTVVDRDEDEWMVGLNGSIKEIER